MPYLQCALAVEEECHGKDSTTNMSYFTGSAAFFLMLVNIPGNLLEILAVVLDPYKNLRTPFNFMMTNLAIADLIVGTVTEPMSIYLHWKEGMGDHVSIAESRVFFMSYFISCTASLLSLAILAVERYVAIRYPYIYRNKLTKKRVLLTAFGVWIISISLPCVYLKVGYITYAFIFVNTAVVMTISIICFMYYFMYRALKTRARSDTPVVTNSEHTIETPENHENTAGTSSNSASNLKNEKASSESRGNSVDDENEALKCQPKDKTSLETDVQGSIENMARLFQENSDKNSTENGNTVTKQNSLENTISENHHSQITVKVERRLTQRFVVVLIALLCCYGPSTIVIYVMTFCTESCSCVTLHWLRDIHFLLVIANSSVNFFAYALRSSRFRKAFAKILRLKKRETTVESTARITESSTDIMHL